MVMSSARPRIGNSRRTRGRTRAQFCGVFTQALVELDGFAVPDD
jgi:hypothetical protein